MRENTPTVTTGMSCINQVSQ